MKALYEKIVPLASNSFKAFAYEKEEFDTAWHFHPEYELTYIVSSRGIRYTGNCFENFEENDLVLLGPNLPHCWKNTGIQIDKARAIVVHWDNDLLGKDWLEKREFENIRKLLRLSEKAVKFENKFALQMKQKLQHFLELPSFNKLTCLLEILNELSLAGESRTLCTEGFQGKLKTDDHERINTIYHYVRNHYTQKITLANIASQVHMGEESFSRFFSKIMNKPFFYFLNEYRVNVASKLLIESDLQVTQISYACGFESLPFFYRQFKKFKNCSPNQYRKEYERLSLLTA